MTSSNDPTANAKTPESEPRGSDTPAPRRLATELSQAYDLAPDPAWDQAFWFKVPFPLRSKSNFRRSTGVRRTEWASNRKFESDLQWLAHNAIPSDWQVGRREDGVKERPVVVALICARTLLDAANLSKSVLDACEGVVYLNDASVALVSTLAERTRSDNSGEVLFCRLPPGATPAQMLTASARLGEVWLTQESPARQ